MATFSDGGGMMIIPPKFEQKSHGVYGRPPAALPSLHIVPSSRPAPADAGNEGGGPHRRYRKAVPPIGLSLKDGRKVSVEDVCTATGAHFNIIKERLTKNGKSEHCVAYARRVGIFVASELTPVPPKDIASCFGIKTVDMVRANLRRDRLRWPQNEALRQDIGAIFELLAH